CLSASGSVVVGLDNLTAAVEPVGAHVVTAVLLAADLIHRQGGAGQGVVGTAHAALGTGGTILLNSHFSLLCFRTCHWQLLPGFQLRQNSERILRRVRNISGGIGALGPALIRIVVGHEGQCQEELILHHVVQVGGVGVDNRSE